MIQAPRKFSLGGLGIGPISGVLIAISIVVAILSRLGRDETVLGYLFITDTVDPDGAPLPEILHGQVWRLLTPIFIHFGIMHLVFNMLWLKDLGTVIERRSTPRLYLALIVVLGVLPNLCQYWFAGPFFGGMSGVVYGLLGYVWMKSKFQPASGFYLNQQTVLMMLGWFVLCWAGVLGPIANGAHTAGLVIGVAWGFIEAKVYQSGR